MKKADAINEIASLRAELQRTTTHAGKYLLNRAIYKLQTKFKNI